MKRNYWPLLFIGIFSFTFAMIIWTINSAVKVPVHEDRSFIKTYQDVDMNYNNIMNSNKDFKVKYKMAIKLNDKKVEFSTEDIKYSQRVLEKISQHKNLLKKGNNTLVLEAIDKQTNEKKKIDIALKITKSISDKDDIDLVTSDFSNNEKTYSSIFEIKEENNWNITGSFTIDGSIGYIFIKTNAI